MQLTQKKIPRTLTNAQIEGFSIHYKNDSGCYKPKTPPPQLQIVANPNKNLPPLYNDLCAQSLGVPTAHTKFVYSSFLCSKTELTTPGLKRGDKKWLCFSFLKEELCNHFPSCIAKDKSILHLSPAHVDPCLYMVKKWIKPTDSCACAVKKIVADTLSLLLG